jgi:hypothetical protein
MTATEYLNTYQGQSLLFNTADPSLRGQCVQSVCFFVQANGFPVIWADAAEWWNRRNNRYDYIANTPDAVPQPGDIMIWSSALPGSGGAGHLAVCLYALPGTGTFVSADSNWGGKTLHQVTHNYNYVIGWMRFKQAAPAPAPAPQPAPAVAAAPAPITQEIEMIANDTQAHQAYQLLRVNGDGNADEIAATAGKRSWAQFASDAQGEVQARNKNLQDQQAHMADMQNVINSTNQTVTDLRATIADDQISNSEKQKALDNAITQIAKDNADITTLHDQVADLQTKLADPIANASAAVEGVAKVAQEKAGKSGGFIVAFFRFLLSAKLPKIKKS